MPLLQRSLSKIQRRHHVRGLEETCVSQFFPGSIFEFDRIDTKMSGKGHETSSKKKSINQ